MGMETSVWQTPQLFGAGSPAGGGAHLVGSLADLPYVLAKMEEDFISPENVQALIWSDLVPCVLTERVLPRWWDVSRNELHAVALYQRAGEELLAASAENKELRSKVTTYPLRPNDSPKDRHSWRMLCEKDVSRRLSSKITPADTFYLTAEIRQKISGGNQFLGGGGA